MVEAESTAMRIPPPWEPQDILTEDALRAAQEYWFQTHATHSRLIAEGRAAVGFMKSHVRRKLEREMGEDFKMYTGSNIGTAQDSAEDSAGIRGELNRILEVIYRRISPTQPIKSPIQEDLTILSHPLGGLEVCYAVTFFYNTLMQRYATLAGNRRKVLKSILDEEMFKWIWRLTISTLLSKDDGKFNFAESLLSTGMNSIPLDMQRVTSARKVLEVGQFLLGKALAESHLRFPLVFYFNTYCRYLQYGLLSTATPQKCDSLYKTMIEHKPGDAVSDMIVAIDQLMNTTGNSGQSFEDILKNEDLEVDKYIPPGEIEFIGQFREFSRSNLGSSLKKIMPKGKPEPGVDAAVSLMPLLLMLRTLPYSLRKKVLEKVPGPVLSMFIIRLGHGKPDEVSRTMVEDIRLAIDLRTKGGEQYSLVSQSAGLKSGMTTIKSTPQAASAKAKGAAEGAAEEAKPAPAAAESAEPAGADSPAAETPPAEARPAAETPPAEARPVEAPAGKRDAVQALWATSGGGNVLDLPVVFDWRVNGDRVTLDTLTVRELLGIAGPEARILFQLIKFALQTGQVFRVPPDKVSKATMEKLIARVIRQAPGDLAPALSKEERISILEAGKNLSSKKFLAALVEKVQQPGSGGGALENVVASLSGKLGVRLQAFLSDPRQEGFREVIQGLSPEEKYAVFILNRVSRLS